LALKQNIVLENWRPATGFRPKTVNIELSDEDDPSARDFGPDEVQLENDESVDHRYMMHLSPRDARRRWLQKAEQGMALLISCG
jgi:hypothetical protein